jgi:TRAP transporter 4TM/12TM fusion protein
MAQALSHSDEGGATSAAPASRLFNVIAATIAIICLVWSFDTQILLGLALYTEQFLALVVGLVLALAFLRYPTWPSKGLGRIDIALAVISIALGLYLGVRIPKLLAEMFFRPVEAFLVSSVLCLLVIETTRRSAGIILPIVFLILFAYGFWGSALPGPLQGMDQSPVRLVNFLGLDPSALFGAPLLIALTTVLAFTFFGRLLQEAGGAEFFTDISGALFSRFRGGTAKVAVVASSLFGMISGSAVANVVTVGVVTIPMMQKAGYRKQMAGAVEAAASTGGQIMPPVMGAAAFLMAENLQVSYGYIAVAAIIPAILYYMSIFIQVDLEAGRRGIASAPDVKVDKMRMLRGGVFFVPFGILFVCLFFYNMSAEKAAIWASGSILVVGMLWGYGGRKLTLKGVKNAITATGRDAIDITCICGLSGMVIGILGITGLSLGLGLWLFDFGKDNLPLLLFAVALLSVLLGMGMPTAAVYLLVATLAAPPLIKLGVVGISAHMFVFYFGVLSMITPPVAMAAFAAASLAKSDPFKTGWQACALTWPAFVLPFAFIYSPELLLEGSLLATVGAVVTALAGVWMGSAGLIGFLFTTIGWGKRVVLVLAGLALIVPPESFDGGYLLNGIALLAGGVIVVRDGLKHWRAGPLASAAQKQV